jgi:hypothetical protein
MGSRFDGLRKHSHTIVREQYGEDAMWLSAQGVVVNQIVLFNDPSSDERMIVKQGRGLANIGYNNHAQEKPFIEFQDGDMAGLYHAVYSGGKEHVRVHSRLYLADTASKQVTGKDYLITLQLADSQCAIVTVGVA